MSEQAVPIYKGQDFYVPAFEVKVGQRRLDRAVIRDITQVSYKDSLKEIDSFELTISNWDAETRDFKYSDRDLFNPGEKVELWMGYFGTSKLRLMLTGEITSLRPAFPAGGQPTLVVSGLNLLHRLRKKQETRSYQGQTDNQIAKAIAQRLGVTIETEENASGAKEEYRYLFQDNQYDILFLLQRARAIGYDLTVLEEGDSRHLQAKPSKLRFAPSENIKASIYELKYGLSLNEFQPTLATAHQVAGVTVRGWDALKKKKIEVTVTRNDLETKGVGKAGGQAAIEQAFSERQEVIVNRPVASEQEARTLARRTLENNAKELVTGSGSVVGLPDLRTGCVVQISGVGKRFSGRYFVTGTTHTIGDGGYTTRFECRREELKD
jgi:phage protein D